MKNVDAEIYLNQLIAFFEKNPNDLIDLIGELKKTKFYKRIKEKVYENVENGLELILTQQQLIDIVVAMYNETNKTVNPIEIKTPVIKTNYGIIWLN
jgi:phosphoenolpyruvate carboxylase